MNINISGEVVRTSQLPKRIIGLGDYLIALNSSPLETSTVLVSDFVSFLNTQFATSLASLTDVSINGPLSGQALVFNGSYWVNQNLVSSLAGLSDVTIASLNPDQLLRYDGTSWKNWTPTFYSLPLGGTTLQYIDGTGALQTFPTALPTGTVRHQVKAGVPITKGQAVYVTSADGTNMIVGLASNASESTSSKTMGLLDATVSTNDFANIVTEGLLTGLDTTGANAAGDPVWLGTGGNLIYGLVNKPYAPNHLVFIGIVTRRNANNGEIFVKVQNGFELDELHNVDARNPNNNDGIFYNSTTQLWEHKQISAIAPTPTLSQVTTAGNTTTNNITVGTLYFGNASHYLVTDNGSYAMLSSNRTLQLATSGNPVLSVFTSQNVAIGTTTDSGFKLDVNGNTRVGGSMTVNNRYLYHQGASAIQYFMTSNAWSGTNSIFFGDDSSSVIGSITYNHQFDSLSFNVNGSTALFINSSRNIGIGTGSPTNAVHIRTAAGGATSNYALVWQESTGDRILGYLGADNSAFFSGALYLYQNGVSNTKITANGTSYLMGGNVLIGTTTDSGYKLDVNGTTRINSSLYITDPSFTGEGRIYQAANNTTVIVGRVAGASENITFGPSNRIFINASQSRFPNGSVQIGSTLTLGNAGNATGTNMLLMQGSITAGSALGRGIGMDTALVAAANNDVLVGLDINPTFTNGAFTGVQNVDLRTKNVNSVFGSGFGYGATYGYDNDGLIQFSTVSDTTVITIRPYSNPININNNYWAKIIQQTSSFKIIPGNYQTGYFRNSAASGAIALGGSEAFSSIGIYIPANTSNVLINTTTDAGYKLDVSGTFRTLVGTETNPFRLEHTNGNYMTMVVGAGSALAAGQFGMYFNGSPMWSWNGAVFRLHGNTISTASNPSTLVVQGGYGGSTVGISIRLSSNTPNQGQWTATTGAQITVEVGNHSNETWAPSSGNASYTLLSIAPRINTTGTYAGIVTGFAYNPTLTSVTGVTHRAIHTVTGDVLLGTTSGNVGVGTTSPFGKLDVKDGEIYVTTSTNANLRSRLTYQGLSVSRASDGGYPEQIISTDSAWQYHSRNRHTLYIDTIPHLQIGNVGISGLNIPQSNNIIIGNSADNGYKLQVKGNAYLAGSAGTTTLNVDFGNVNSNVKILSHGSSDFTQIQIGTNFSLSRNGGGDPSIGTTFGLGIISSSLSLQTSTASPGKLWLKGNYGLGSAYFGANNSNGVTASTLYFQNSETPTAAQNVLATFNLWGISDNATAPTIPASSMFSLHSTTRGFLPPRLTTAEILAISSPSEGLQVYNTDLKTICFYNGTAWQRVTSTAM